MENVSKNRLAKTETVESIDGVLKDRKTYIPFHKSLYECSESYPNYVQVHFTRALFTIIVENFFIFLLGFFIGIGLTMLICINVFYTPFHRCKNATLQCNVTTNAFDEDMKKNINCFSLVMSFILAIGAVLLLFCLFKYFIITFENNTKTNIGKVSLTI